MSGPYPPVVRRLGRLLHGADYNPDQWPADVRDEDMRLMRLARCNAMAVGIFSWAHLEPEEGVYTFGWLDDVMDRLAAQGAVALLATPSAAPPAWMSAAYPEILRTGPDRSRRLHGNRVNTCWTSPVYREKCRAMARALAARYGSHPALGVWHLFNEYGGECFCGLCEAAFREWLRAKFGTLDELNAAWWTSFWGHDYTDWEQITAPGGPYGERSIMGLTIDWRRFTTDQVVSFMRCEADVLRSVVPVTTNMMGVYQGLDYWRLAPHLDVVSWDSYPTYHDREGDGGYGGRSERSERAPHADWLTASFVSMTHDLYRTLKGGRPFLLMESTPSSTNWFERAKLKRPGVHRLQSLQAVAHGSDSVQYFQWRQSRGGSEKFHGAVVSHEGSEHTRVFRDVAEVGELLERLGDVSGTSIAPQVAVILDWENAWAIDAAQGPHRDKRYLRTVGDWYRALWKLGVPVDVPQSTCDLTPYRLVIAPMLYMLRPGVAESLERFVRAGGTLVATYWTGIVDENDLCFAGGFPGPLRGLLGVWAEEIDVLYDDESARVEAVPGNRLGLTGRFEARTFCELVHARGAEVVATYTSQFYAGRPALTVNRSGAGEAWYVAARFEHDFLDVFVRRLVGGARIARALDADLPEGVTAQVRTDGASDFVFVLNFRRAPQRLTLRESGLSDALSGAAVSGALDLKGYGSIVLRRPSRFSPTSSSRP